jgi:Fe2+ transport system protein FeoA
MNRNKETTLEKARCGKPVRVTRLDADHEAHQRLCEMGFCENACIRKITHGAALICLVVGVRVAISARLAEKIFVKEIGGNLVSDEG